MKDESRSRFSLKPLIAVFTSKAKVSYVGSEAGGKWKSVGVKIAPISDTLLCKTTFNSALVHVIKQPRSKFYELKLPRHYLLYLSTK